MQTVKAIINNITGEQLPIDKMKIMYATDNYVLAKYKGFGFLKAYTPCDGYTIILANT